MTKRLPIWLNLAEASKLYFALVLQDINHGNIDPEVLGAVGDLVDELADAE